MRILIVGAGEVGLTLARRFAKERHEIVLIDRDATQAQKVREQVDALVLEGNGASPVVLDQAEISSCQMLIAVTDIDEVNVVACMLAKEYGVKHRIARVKNPDYYREDPVLTKERMGIDLMINPQQQVSEEFMRLIQTPGVASAATFLGGRVHLVELKVEDDDPLVSTKLKDLAELRKLCSFLIVAISRGGNLLIPQGEDRILAGDRLFIVGRRELIPEVLSLFDKLRPSVRTAFLVGGGKTGLELAMMLEAQGLRTKLLELDRARCDELSTKLGTTLVLHGNGTDLDLLTDEDVGAADVFVALTQNDEVNLIAGLIAKQLGAKSTFALINAADYLSLVGTLGIDAVLSPRQVTADAILRFVRRGQVLSVATVDVDQAEILELAAGPNASCVGTPLQELKLPRGCIVGALLHEGDVIIPGGTDVISPSDKVVVFSRRESIRDVERLFS